MNNKYTHLIMFHHAGGNSSIFYDFTKYCSNDFNIIQLEMPGRGKRRLEPLMYHIDDIIEDFSSRIPTNGNIVLFGYSLGAYIAYVISAYCRKKESKRNILLVVISNEPIHCRNKFSFLGIGKQEYQQKMLLQFIQKLGAIPEWLKNSPTMLQRFLRVLEADLYVADSISEEQSFPLDNIPILAMYGNKDPLMNTPPYRWKECTRHKFNLVEVLGGHFILSEKGFEIYKSMIDFIHAITFNHDL
ncbi:thioesterase II family protein [Xenorhabdus sp. KJ12.1]|uniref:thioesterase II family protein n=1 Tax=Xenorhabdus sp. KJ12.1 TaxID=1851571 RepID=UPI000C042923|nr:alpha/beta fold hydrolase [Xenorhabdus sp. KJ12.1]PHM72168.1 putative thioesterase involved in non-ribosomal peptide biosynthesis [Xenorhabdus sp. KJ12.1]